MNKNIRWITETAVMLALLIALQAVTKPLGQLVTGSFVNAVLAVTVLVAGCSSGLTVAIISPVLAYLLGITGQILTVPPIMAGNAAFVLALYFIAGKDSRKLLRQILAWISAAGVKFMLLYVLVVWLLGHLLPPIALASFSWPQLVTALIGGGVALLITPVLRKARHHFG